MKFRRRPRGELATRDPRAFLDRLGDALRLVALPADEQVAALPDFVHVPDEVVLVYEDVWLGLPHVYEAGVLTDEQFEALARLDRHHQAMCSASDKDCLLTLDAMHSDERWEEGRRLAAEGLAALGQSPGKPAFAGTTWIRGSE